MTGQRLSRPTRLLLTFLGLEAALGGWASMMTAGTVTPLTFPLGGWLWLVPLAWAGATALNPKRWPMAPLTEPCEWGTGTWSVCRWEAPPEYRCPRHRYIPPLPKEAPQCPRCCLPTTYMCGCKT